MRTLMISLLAATSLSATADDHYYAGFQLGLTASPEEPLSRSSDDLSLDMEKNLGPVAGLFVGKKRGNMRYELEYALRKNYFDGLEVGNPASTGLVAGNEYNAGGSQKSDSLMANVWREFDLKDKWSLLGGLGFGLSHITLDKVRSGQNGPFADTQKWAPAMQAMAQVAHPIGNGLEFGLGYRYFQALSGDFSSSARGIDYKAKNHEVFARISWRFGGEKPVAKAAPAPMPVAAPAPKPKPAPAPKPVAVVPLPGPFIVFFDFDKSTITDEAASIIKAAAKAFNDHKAVKIEATGHTDRAGTASYNLELSEKRAEAVRKALMAEGIKSSNIQLSHKGENSLMVNTDDSVAEAQNRRTEIKLVR